MLQALVLQADGGPRMCRVVARASHGRLFLCGYPQGSFLYQWWLAVLFVFLNFVPKFSLIFVLLVVAGDLQEGKS